ncbi:MAG TPA: hypothetical protein DCP40_14300 [Stenotrophomonas sp.]|nr:hypothetical protein [Stenotrophomonas sp.]
MIEEVNHRRSLLPARILLGFSAVALLILFASSWSMPPVDASGFRQTQTALSIDWLLRGGPWLDYLTPVIGAPWSIPFEFPLYQWLAALLSAATGLSADNSGRLVSLLFHVGSIFMVYRAVLAFRPDRLLALCVAAAFAVSPFAQFWGRAVLIESTAVFFGLVFVWAMAGLRSRPTALLGGVAVLAAVLSALVKITTFFAYAAFVALAFLWLAVREHGWRPQWLAAHWKLLAWGVAAALAVLATLLLWLQHADALKAQSALGQQVTSEGLSAFNYGTLQQRLDPATWGAVFKKRFGAATGSNWVFVLIVAAGLGMRRTRAAVALLLLAYLVPFLVFTNLQVVHPYYQAAQVVFATSIVGLVLWALVLRAQASGRYRWAIAFAVLLCLLSTGFGLAHYLKNMKEARQPSDISQIAALIQAGTPQDGVVLALGQDWSSELPYRAGRRGVMVPDWASDDVLRSLVETDVALGGLPLAALVVCPNQLASTAERAHWQAQLLQRYSTGAQKQVVGQCEVWLQPAR